MSRFLFAELRGRDSASHRKSNIPALNKSIHCCASINVYFACGIFECFAVLICFEVVRVVARKAELQASKFFIDSQLIFNLECQPFSTGFQFGRVRVVSRWPPCRRI